MKTLKRITAGVLLLTMVVVLCACSTYPSIQKSFLDAGYKAVSTSEDNTALSLEGKFEDVDLKVTTHLFKTEGLLGIDVYALVVEFESEAALKAYMSDDEETSATIKGFISDAQKADCVNGNCLLIPITITKISEMLDIFKQTKAK